MNLSRRSFLASAFATAILCPTDLIRPARRRIDLAAFCGLTDGPFQHQYDLSSPFVQAERLYATDGRICLCVPPLAADVTIATAKLPPAAALPYWNHDSRHGWLDLPERPQVLTAMGWCPDCNGTGYVAPRVDCGCGDGCHECFGIGYTAHAGKCPTCKGQPWRPLPTIVRLGHDSFFEFEQFAKVAGIGDVEYSPGLDGPPPKTSAVAPLRFRFAEGVGLIMPLDPREAEKRIEEARRA